MKEILLLISRHAQTEISIIMNQNLVHGNGAQWLNSARVGLPSASLPLFLAYCQLTLALWPLTSVRGNFDTLPNFGIGGLGTKPFGALDPHIGWFGLVYHL